MDEWECFKQLEEVQSNEVAFLDELLNWAHCDDNANVSFVFWLDFQASMLLDSCFGVSDFFVFN